MMSRLLEKSCTRAGWKRNNWPTVLVMVKSTPGITAPGRLAQLGVNFWGQAAAVFSWFMPSRNVILISAGLYQNFVPFLSTFVLRVAKSSMLKRITTNLRVVGERV